MNTKRRKAARAALPQVCVKCGSTENLTLDHKLARGLGGSSQQHNLQILCNACNQAKSRLEGEEAAEREKLERKLRKQAKGAYFQRLALEKRIEAERLAKAGRAWAKKPRAA